MSDQETRALEKAVQRDPSDTEAKIALFVARRRNGTPTTSYFRLRNIQNGKYYETMGYDYNNYDYSAGGRVSKKLVETTVEMEPGRRGGGFYSCREEVIKEIDRLHKAKQDLSKYQLVEFQTMTLEIAGPPVDTMLDQIEVELLQAKKETQLKKLKKIEEEEQALLDAKKEAQLKKIKKLEEQEQSLKNGGKKKAKQTSKDD